MANDTARPAPLFIPRTVASYERTTNAIVSRFAEPVRAIGIRTLGLIDRIIGQRLFGFNPGEPQVSAAAGSKDTGYLYARPWYETPQSAVRTAAVARAAAAQQQAAAPSPSIEETLVAPAAPPVAVEPEAPAISTRAAQAPAIHDHVINASPASAVEQPAPASSPAPAQIAEAAAALAAAHETARAVATQAATVQAAQTAATQQAATQQAAQAAAAQTAATQAAQAEATQAARAVASQATQAAATQAAQVAAAQASAAQAAHGEAVRKVATEAAQRAASSGPAAAQDVPAATSATATPSAPSSPSASDELVASFSLAAPGSAVASQPIAEARVDAPATADVAEREVRAREVVARAFQTVAAQLAGLPPSLVTSPVAPTPAQVAQQTTAFGRAFAHTAWVDRQLARSSAPAEERPVTGGGYVLVTPDAAPAPVGQRQPVAASPFVAPPAPVAAAAPLQSSPVMSRAAQAPAPTFIAPAVEAPKVDAPVARAAAPSAAAPTAEPAAPSVASASPSSPAASAPIAATPLPSVGAPPAAPVASADSPLAPSAVDPVVLEAVAPSPAAQIPYEEPARTSTAPAIGNVPSPAFTPAAPIPGAPWAGLPDLVAPRSFGAAASASSFGSGAPAMPDIRALSSLTPADDAQSTIARFVERLVGVRSSVDARVLPVGVAPAAAATVAGAMGELVRLADGRPAAPSRPGATPAAATAPASGEAVSPSLAARAADAAAFTASLVAAGVAPGRPGAAAAVARTAIAQRAAEPGATAPRSLPGDLSSPFAIAASSPELSPVLRPGGIGVRAEQLAGNIGIRAAGVSIDFIDPERLSSLVSGRSSEFSYLWAAPGWVASLGADAGSLSSGGARAQAPQTFVAPFFPGAPVGVAPGGTAQSIPGAPSAAVPGASQPVGQSPEVEFSIQPPSTQSPSTSPSGAPMAQAAHMADAEVSRRMEAVWSLIRVFPASAQSVLAATAQELGPRRFQSMPVLAASATSHQDGPAGAATATGPLGAFATSAPSDAMAPASSGSASASVAGGAATYAAPVGGVASPGAGQSGRATVAEGPSTAPAREKGAPASYVAPIAPARRTVPALDRPLLPDGRMPRGGFIWSRAASFMPQVGDWIPPASVTAASSGAEAAAAGVPAWGGMTPVEIPSVQAALADSTYPAVSGARNRGGPERPVVSPAPRPEVSAAASLLGEHGAPLLRLVTAAAGGSPVASNANPPAWLPPLVQPPPPVRSAPSSEASARMLEALRSQVQHSTPDDRVTLADLTLVAAASSSQQLAASSAPASSSSQTHQSQGGSGGKGEKAEKKSPEAERREIEEIARHVLDEVERMCEIARERNGDPWEA